ncbi:hypothetical protein CKO50_23510 [Pseudoalteromonas sp. HM-SA03]|uniref:DUF2326 domain-containing protein n=1 Tax=Pseudoalteromonas sp. HM-SA03 TaxID=2029678 RepID=UPI000BAE2823|nr:DUF2326 domain-containing protein [Pseudoalteromonas sp. HM-SA03]PAX98971.1 hypothetical protein CKO50_23510 [Pseudoalteromonas sp. HM-SA03]
MFLKSLIIESEDQIIREITFHKGMNFIVDDTKSSTGNVKDTGNNIGKTTVLRLINYCLGGSDKGIYQSKEFKNNNNAEVKNFLISNKVIVTLKLVDDLDDPFSRQLEIRRNFLSRAEKILEINEEAVKSKDLDDELKKLVFGFQGEKPTFKQLKAKFIRDEAERLENTVRVLGSFGRLEEYEALYLFWLGIEYPDAEKKRALLDERKLEVSLYSRLSEETNESKLTQFLKIIERDIEGLEKQKGDFNINHDYESDLEELNKVRSKLNSLYSSQSQIELRKELVIESKDELKASLANEQFDDLFELYEQAKNLLPTLQKSYVDTVKFHNAMVQEKIQFITDELPNLNLQLSQTTSEIQLNLSKEKSLVEKLNKAEILEELQEIIAKLNEKYEQKGRLEEKRSKLIAAKSSIERIDLKLSLIDKSIFELDDLIQERVAIFNKYFSEISNELYGEKFAMSALFEQKSNTEQKFYKLYIDSLNGQTGTGKKKGEIAAFDIAYVKFADEIEQPTLHFILHDQMEVVDDNQIKGLANQVINANCQFVVPILRDKLPKELDKPEFQVVSLSQSNKLFKV